MKNQVLNGCFRLAQRGTSFTNPANGAYTLDRWFTGYTGTIYSTLSQQSFTVGQTDVPGEPTNYMRWVFNTGSTGTNPYVAQRREGVRGNAGQPVVVTFYAKISTAQSLTLKYTQNFGTSGSTSVTNSVGLFNLTTSWQKFTAVFTPPSISGKTVNANNYLELGFYLNGTPLSGLTLEIANVQLEVGSSPTAFEDRSLAEELFLCRRYFFKTYNIDVNPGTGSWATGYTYGYGDYGMSYGILTYEFPVSMRTSPTVVVYSPSSGASGYTYDSGVGDRALYAASPSPNNLRINLYSTYAGTFSAHFTASAEL